MIKNNDELCWSCFAKNDLKRFLDQQLKRAWKTYMYTKETLFPVGSHVVAKAKKSKGSEFKFPWIEESMSY